MDKNPSSFYRNCAGKFWSFSCTGDSFYLAHTFRYNSTTVCVLRRIQLFKSFREVFTFQALTKKYDNCKITLRHSQEPLSFKCLQKLLQKSTKKRWVKNFFGLFNFTFFFYLWHSKISALYILCSEKFSPYYRTGYNQFPMQIKNNNKSVLRITPIALGERGNFQSHK